ncbi:MAG: succinate dehydrogenase assembly factor 2 [Lysobacter sp.]|nr:succinate dehydrogenase assembly factor 2 [Lysobacter sp.]
MRAPTDAERIELQKLRWRSRRGMRELDQLMERYLAQRWLDADDAERAVFDRLLVCEDDRLWRWFLGYETAEDADLHALVERIRTLPH